MLICQDLHQLLMSFLYWAGQTCRQVCPHNMLTLPFSSSGRYNYAMKDLAKAYNPTDYEAKIYAQWEKSGAFKPAMTASKSPFSIILPPPNANGHIHLGTAMFVIEDIMIRYRRMQGHPTLWLPGTDHAGIETQVVYERKLAAEGKSRFDLGRDEFNRQVTAFTRENQGIMISELKSMGFSLDWSRLQFTLDDGIVATVYDNFKKLHDAGFIYRANRLVNWCPHCRSAFSDIEVKYREQMDPLYYIKYGPFVLATVRPETKFGDTAIAVNPKDERYTKYIGQQIEAEGLLGNFKLKVIADSFVDPEFGTGVVKVTPGHDPNDWEMGIRHNLEVKQVIGTDGLLTSVAGKYAGMPVAEARAQVAHDLEERGLIDHIDMSYTHKIGFHDRCGTLIEPLTTEQWWLNVQELKKPVIDAIKADDVTFVPSRFKRVELEWMEGLRDWNIGRQNWYGIRIPVYYNATDNTSLPEYIVAADESEAKKVYGDGGYEAETDIFDTWFSSGQWPYATLMESGPDDLSTFYPTTVLETGRDILFPWVSRMLMFGIFATGEVPFKTVYLHGLITDGTGKKMSKSKGNVINPLDMTAKFGTDALRLALIIGITPGNDGAVSEEKIQGYRNFCNKLWNVARYVISQLPDDYSPTNPEPKTAADAWILNKLNNTVREVTAAIEEYRFSEAGQLAYSLLWNDFADWYVEASKSEQNTNILYHGLVTILKLVHPFAPFVSEAIWEALPATNGQLISAEWPAADKASAELKKSAHEFDSILAVVAELRSIKSSLSLTKLTVGYAPSDFWTTHGELISKLTRQIEIKTGIGESGIPVLSSPTAAQIEIDPDTLASTIKRLEADKTTKEGFVKNFESKLANVSYVSSAPAQIVQDTRDKLEEALMLISKLDEQLNQLKS